MLIAARLPFSRVVAPNGVGEPFSNCTNEIGRQVCSRRHDDTVPLAVKTDDSSRAGIDAAEVIAHLAQFCGDLGPGDRLEPLQAPEQLKESPGEPRSRLPLGGDDHKQLLRQSIAPELRELPAQIAGPSNLDQNADRPLRQFPKAVLPPDVRRVGAGSSVRRDIVLRAAQGEKRADRFVERISQVFFARDPDVLIFLGPAGVQALRPASVSFLPPDDEELGLLIEGPQIEYGRPTVGCDDLGHRRVLQPSGQSQPVQAERNQESPRQDQRPHGKRDLPAITDRPDYCAEGDESCYRNEAPASCDQGETHAPCSERPRAAHGKCEHGKRGDGERKQEGEEEDVEKEGMYILAWQGPRDHAYTHGYSQSPAGCEDQRNERRRVTLSSGPRVHRVHERRGRKPKHDQQEEIADDKHYARYLARPSAARLRR